MMTGASRFSVLKAEELRDVAEECRLLILRQALRTYSKTSGQRMVDWGFMIAVCLCGTFRLFIGFVKWRHPGAILTMFLFVFMVCGVFGVVYKLRGRVLLRAYLQTDSGAGELLK
jgi:hypothetical protein